ncbi:MAG: OPT/YSL family transporter [Nitrospirales bacterium]|nr:OPT/YSL family transporter [Nitrospirales bacterium]
MIGLCVSLVFGVLIQITLFNISIGIAVLAVLLSFVLALVAGRVSGETGITPIGAMGKVTQLTFGFLIPGNATTNLMAANVTGGAAGQCRTFFTI